MKCAFRSMFLGLLLGTSGCVLFHPVGPVYVSTERFDASAASGATASNSQNALEHLGMRGRRAGAERVVFTRPDEPHARVVLTLRGNAVALRGEVDWQARADAALTVRHAMRELRRVIEGPPTAAPSSAVVGPSVPPPTSALLPRSN